MCTLRVFQFLTAVFMSHWVSVQLKDSSSQCQIPGLGCPVCALNASLSREAIQAIIFSSSVHPPWGLYPNLITSLPFPPDSVWIFLHSLGVRRDFVPVSNLLLVRNAPHVDLLFMCLQGQASSVPYYPTLLISSSQIFKILNNLLQRAIYHAQNENVVQY